MPTIICSAVVLGLVLAAQCGAAPLAVKMQPGPMGHFGDAKSALPLVSGRGLTATVDLPLGRVRIAAALRYNGKGTAYRQTVFHLTCGEQSAGATVDELASGTPLVLSFVNRTPGRAEIRLSGGTLTPAGQAESNRLLGTGVTIDASKAADLGDGGAPRKKDTGGGLDLGDSDLAAETQTDVAASPLPALLLAKLEAAGTSGTVLVRGVSSDRITYPPNAHGTCTVLLENLGAEPADADLTVDLITGTADSRPLFAGKITVAAGKTAEKSMPFETGAELWGRGIEARARSASGEDRAAHAFSVVTHPYQVAFHGRGTPMSGSDLWTPEQAEIEAERIARANLDAYCNIYEAFAWAPCDYSEMTPDNDEPFYSGQTQYCKKRSSLQTLHRVFRKYGISSITYGKACASGLPGLQYAHRYPERMNVFGLFGFAHESCRVDIIDRMLENRYRKHGIHEDFWQSWISCWTHFGDLDAENYGCDEIVRSAKLLGWDGVRYDGHFTWWQDPPGCAKTVEYCAERIRRQIPGFAIGYNYMGPRHNTPAGAFTDVELAACASGGGMVMSEVYRNFIGDVAVNIGHLQAGGDMVRLHGGYWLAILDQGSIWNNALVLAGGARPMGGTMLNKFGTRFSGYILDPAMRRLQDPGRIVKPVGEPGFFWDKFVYEKDTGADRAALILQLVNIGPGFAFTGAKSPPIGVGPVRRDVTFSLDLPPGYRAESAFACDDYDTFAPLPVALNGQRLVVPQVKVWTLVVVNLRKSADAKPLAELCAVPVRVDGITGDAVQERAAVGIGTTFGPEEMKQAKAEKLVVTPAVLKAILASAELPNSAPGPKAYLAADFTAHQDGSDAKSFRGSSGALALRRNGRLEVHLARGVFAHLDRLEEALARLGEVTVTDSAFAGGDGQLSDKNGLGVTGFPGREALRELDVLVLDCIPATALSQQARRDVLDFVQGGGGLVVLGGWYSLSKGGYEGSFLEDALPVLCRQAAYLRRLQPEQGVLKALPALAAVIGGPAPDFGKQASVAWLNHVQPRPGAEVLMGTADGLPVLVAGACGKGRVAVFAGAHAGEPQTPYWLSPAWPALLAGVVKHVAAGAETTTPPDAKELSAVQAAVAALDAGELDESTDKAARVLEQVRQAAGAGTEVAARAAAAYMLAHPEQIEPAEIEGLVERILPQVSRKPEWATLVAKYLDMPPVGFGNLVGEIAATAATDVKFATVMKWQQLDERTRLRCIAAAGDPAAVPYLRRLEDGLAARDKALSDTLREKGGGNPETAGMLPAETRVQRMAIAWALIRCGQRDEETLRRFCRGILELPYYAWRQRWMIEGAWEAAREAELSAADVKARQAKARAMEREALALDRMIRLWGPLFRPAVVGTDAIGKRAAAQALRDCNCQKALPVALAYLREVEPKDLPDFAGLAAAQLDSIRLYYGSRTPR